MQISTNWIMIYFSIYFGDDNIYGPVLRLSTPHLSPMGWGGTLPATGGKGRSHVGAVDGSMQRRNMGWGVHNIYVYIYIYIHMYTLYTYICYICSI